MKKKILFRDFVPSKLSQLTVTVNGKVESIHFEEETDLICLTHLMDCIRYTAIKPSIDIGIGYDPMQPLTEIIAEDYCSKYKEDVRYIPDSELEELVSEINQDVKNLYKQYNFPDCEVDLKHVSTKVTQLLKATMDIDTTYIMTKCDATDEREFKDFFKVIGKRFIDETYTNAALTQMYCQYLQAQTNFKTPLVHIQLPDDEVMTNDLKPIAFQYLQEFIHKGSKVELSEFNVTTFAHVLQKCIKDFFDELKYHYEKQVEGGVNVY